MENAINWEFMGVLLTAIVALVTGVFGAVTLIDKKMDKKIKQHDDLSKEKVQRHGEEIDDLKEQAHDLVVTLKEVRDMVISQGAKQEVFQTAINGRFQSDEEWKSSIENVVKDLKKGQDDIYTEIIKNRL